MRKTLLIANIGRQITVQYEGADSYAIDLSKWTIAVLTAFQALNKAISSLIPTDRFILEFAQHPLTDDFSSPAIFKQAPNAAWMDPLRSQLWDTMLSHFEFSKDGDPSLAALQSWLDKDQSMLAILATLLTLTSGSCPNQTEFSVLIDSIPSDIRSIWLLHTGEIVWRNRHGTPKMIDGKIRPTLFCFPAFMTSPILFYICILRPIGCKLLSLISRDTQLYSTELFSHYKYVQANNGLWNSVDISNAVLVHTRDIFNTPLTSPRNIRHYIGPFLERLVGDSMDHTGSCLVDLAAQHTTSTSLRHYGRIGEFPNLPKLSFHQPEKFLSICQLWHFLLGIGPGRDGLLQIVSKHDLVPAAIAGIGLRHARSALQYTDLKDVNWVNQALKTRSSVFSKWKL
jgi:hypothetical protein